MFLSIIIPVYNAEKYLAECLDSCLNQDIPAGEYEIICVDDESTDNSWGILEEYDKAHDYITILKKHHNDGNGGRNVGLPYAKGDYIWFVDNDDLLLPNCFSMLKSVADECRCDRISFPSYKFTDELTEEERRKIESKTLPDNGEYLRDTTVWSSIFKRSFLLENEVFPRSVRLIGKPVGQCVDTFFVYECKKAKASEKRLDGEALYFYRLRSGSETHVFSVEALRSRMNSTFIISKLLYGDYKACTDGQIKPCMADYLMTVYRQGLFMLAKMPEDVYRQTVKELKNDGLFPMKQPKECSESISDVLCKEKGLAKWKSAVYFYSIRPWGLFCASLFYRKHRLKVKMSQALRKNKLMNRLLDFKNKLLRR